MSKLALFFVYCFVGKDKVLALFMANISIDLNDFVYSLEDGPKA